mmetsp:Transcript_20402/g.65832  ORF Transcript_20402/g.65832 Transcript_20402/m.65832 type:complete len:585 (-) Transcript_20402:35-1789(-)
MEKQAQHSPPVIDRFQGLTPSNSSGQISHQDTHEVGSQLPEALSNSAPASILETVVVVDEVGAAIVGDSDNEGDAKESDLEAHDEDPVLAELGRGRARFYKAATILAGVFGSVIQTFVIRMEIDHGGENLGVPWGALLALLYSPAIVILNLEPWKAAFPPQSDLAERSDRLVVAACIVVCAPLRFCQSYFTSGSNVKSLFNILLALYDYLVLFFAATVFRYRHAYGGLRRVLDHCTGILVATYWLVCLAVRLIDHQVLFLLASGMLIFVFPPYMLLVYPKFQCARRHFFDRDRGGGIESERVQPEAGERDAALLVLLALSSGGLPWAIGSSSASLYALAPVGSVKGVLIVLFLQGVLALLTWVFQVIAAGAVTLRKSIPFVFFLVLTADAFVSLVFMTTNFREASFWILMAVDLLLVVMRDAHLWSRVQKRIAALHVGQGAVDGMIGAMCMPEQLASICEVSECTATLAVMSVAITEIISEAVGAGVSGMTIGMSQQERWDVFSGQSIVFASQIVAMMVSRTILRLKRGKKTGNSKSQKAAEAEYAILQLWHERGFYMASCAVCVMMSLVSSAAIVKLQMHNEG